MVRTEAPAWRKPPDNGNSSEPTATAPVVDSTRLEPPVVQERGQALPALEHVVDRLDERRPARDPVLHRDQTGLQRLHQRLRLRLARRTAFPGVEAADLL